MRGLDELQGLVLNIGSSISKQLIDWLFNGTSTQKGQFVPTAGKGNWLSVTQFAVKHSRYTNATTGYLIDVLQSANKAGVKYW